MAPVCRANNATFLLNRSSATSRRRMDNLLSKGGATLRRELVPDQKWFESGAYKMVLSGYVKNWIEEELGA
ncbi:hypothetical protein HNY73_005960 [Argiope bruennichi]|uniref:Uncharacterized protein n=1 Tax=Argiope bruennichi TaxID=94029 RepID=A0A8T0FLC8_ARGBR|nr:hypothetical protein HNY73_005960 [Argiope bruennichi]